MEVVSSQKYWEGLMGYQTSVKSFRTGMIGR